MAKGAKKRRASRKKQEKALRDTQTSCPSVESCPLEENEEDVFSPKTPVQASEGEDKDRMFDMVGGLAYPSSHTDEVVISDGVEYKSGSFENCGFQEFSASGKGEVGNSEILGKISESAQLSPLEQFRVWDVSRKINDKHASIQSSTQEGDEGNAVSFDQCEADLIEASKRSELEIRYHNKNSMERMHNENCTIRDIAVNNFSLSPTHVTTSQIFKDNSEGFHLIPCEVLQSFNSCVEREPAMQKEDEMNSLSKQQNGHRKETVINNSEPGTFDGNSSKDEIGYEDRELLEEVHYEKRSIERSASHDISGRLGSHKSHDFEADDPIPSERLATEAEKIESPTIFDEGYSMCAFQRVLGSSSPRKLECSTVPAGEGRLEPAQGQSAHLKDVSVDILGQDDADTSKQVKDELWDFYRPTQPTRESIEMLETYESNAYQAQKFSLSESLEIGTSGKGGLENLQEHNGYEKETNLDNSESRIFEMLQSTDNYKTDHVCVEVNNQPKDANAMNDSTKMPKEEYPSVPFPAAKMEPSVNTSHSLVAADLESNKSSGVVLLDNEVNNNNVHNLRDISKEPAQQTHFLKLNGEEKDAHLENTFPGDLHREGKGTAIFPQGNEKLGRRFCFRGVLEFLLCWRD